MKRAMLQRMRSRRDHSLMLSLYIDRHPDAKVICVSGGIKAPHPTMARAISAVGYSQPLNTIVIEYYE